MQVEIFTDVVCPWCYVGLARFRHALDGFARRDEVEVVHRAFELDPTLPPGRNGSTLDMLAAKYGMTREQARAAEDRVGALAADEGLPFRVDRPHGSSFDAHRLMRLATERGRGGEARDAVYRAHFGGGHDIFDPAELASVVVGAGLDAGEVHDVLAGDRYSEAVRADEQLAARYGIGGVPFVVLGGRLGVSGAQPTDAFAQALEQAWQQAHAGSGAPS
jgi:predicted DsbA family dithiol-disulfide isomerase